MFASRIGIRAGVRHRHNICSQRKYHSNKEYVNLRPAVVIAMKLAGKCPTIISLCSLSKLWWPRMVPREQGELRADFTPLGWSKSRDARRKSFSFKLEEE